MPRASASLLDMSQDLSSPWLLSQSHKKKSTTTRSLKAVDWLIHDSPAVLKYTLYSKDLLARSGCILCPSLPIMRKKSIKHVGFNVASRDLFSLSNPGFSSVTSVSQMFSLSMCFLQLLALRLLQAWWASCWRLTIHTASSTDNRPWHQLSQAQMAQPILYLACIILHYQVIAPHKPLSHHDSSQRSIA